MSTLRIGTCSWKYPSWKGLVYSAEKKINFLEEYALKYNSVEIDQWFWSLFGADMVSLPRATVVDEYVQSVPEDFRFTIKVPNSITLTHYYRKKKPDPLVVNPHYLSNTLFNDFLALLSPMRSRLGPLMFQFEYLNQQKMVSEHIYLDGLKTFFEACDRSIPYAIETRNPNYLNQRYFEFLVRNNLSHVFLQGYFMPSITDLYDKFRLFVRNTAVIRLHGGDRKEIEETSGEEWNRVWEDRSKELRSVADMIKDLLSRGVTVYLNVNNHYEGSAPLTIQRIEKLLNKKAL